jgi:hypothetical protein
MVSVILKVGGPFMVNFYVDFFKKFSRLWLGMDNVRTHNNKRHIFKKDSTVCSNYDNHNGFNGQDNLRGVGGGKG